MKVFITILFVLVISCVNAQDYQHTGDYDTIPAFFKCNSLHYNLSKEVIIKGYVIYEWLERADMDNMPVYDDEQELITDDIKVVSTVVDWKFRPLTEKWFVWNWKEFKKVNKKQFKKLPKVENAL